MDCDNFNGIYAPRAGESKAEDLLLEQSLGYPILQVLTLF